MRFTINVDVALRDGDQWILIERGVHEEHAAGRLSLAGGTCEAPEPCADLLELTARREVKEELGLVLSGALHYVESAYFVTDAGEPVLNVVFLSDVTGQSPTPDPYEVGAVLWRDLASLQSDPECPEWTLRGVTKAEERWRSLLA